MVVAIAGFSVFRLHGIFGSEETGSGDVRDESKPIIPKDVVYEVFGPAGTQGQVNYLDENAQSQRADFKTLPWSYPIRRPSRRYSPTSSRRG